MNQSFDVMVIGGGVVGLAAALATHQRGFSVALIDAHALSPDTHQIDARVYAINQASQSLFEVLGVWEHLNQARLSPYDHMHVWDAVTGASLDFDARMVGYPYLGTIIEESILKQALLKQAVSENIAIFSSCPILSVRKTPDAMFVSDGTEEWQAGLMIVADGPNSPLREMLGVSVTSWPYHQDAIVATVKTEQPHRSTAFQVFHPDGPLAFLPLADPHHCSIVWSTSKASALKQLSDDQFALALTASFARTLGQVQLLGKRFYFPLLMRHVKQYAGARWVFMGDAAHTIHPLAGLGLNVGLADVQAWCAQLDSMNGKAWSTKMLGAYQRQRKFEVWQMIVCMEGIKALFANPLSPVATVRGLGVKACDALAPLKRWLIQQAAG